MMLRKIGLLIFFISAIAACSGQQTQNTEANPSDANTPALTACPDERPQACTFDYRPVCASVDTGIRCVRSPCPSTKQKTYGNACSACADEKVIGFIPGECPAPTPAPAPTMEK